MTQSINPLLDAVDELTLPRKLVVVQHYDEPHTHRLPNGEIEQCADLGPHIHSEEHAPLLVLLLEGTGLSTASKSSDVRIPIDADALELWSQIRDLVKLWCRQLDASWIPDDLLVSVRHWYLAHSNAVRSAKVKDQTDHDITRMVEGWARMILKKFEPDEKREWTDPCPAFIPTLNIDGDIIGHRRCNARRIVINGEERFAIQLNVTTLTAECGRCHTKWVGDRGLATLRYETNLYNLERAETEEQRDKALADMARLAGQDKEMSA